MSDTFDVVTGRERYDNKVAQSMKRELYVWKSDNILWDRGCVYLVFYINFQYFKILDVSKFYGTTSLVQN